MFVETATLPSATGTAGPTTTLSLMLPSDTPTAMNPMTVTNTPSTMPPIKLAPEPLMPLIAPSTMMTPKSGPNTLLMCLTSMMGNGGYATEVPVDAAVGENHTAGTTSPATTTTA